MDFRSSSIFTCSLACVSASRRKDCPRTSNRWIFCRMTSEALSERSTARRAVRQVSRWINKADSCSAIPSLLR